MHLPRKKNSCNDCEFANDSAKMCQNPKKQHRNQVRQTSVNQIEDAEKEKTVNYILRCNQLYNWVYDSTYDNKNEAAKNKTPQGDNANWKHGKHHNDGFMFMQHHQ